MLLHRSIIGRALYAIGFSAAGARYAGIPVVRRLALVYFLSGLSASVAAIVYVAHLGQARSDAGSGYELDAITAVVLGGTSVFGGRGTLFGTVLGLFALSVLRNGLRLAALPSELAGVLTGTLLLVTIAIDRARIRGRRAAHVYSTTRGHRREEQPGCRPLCHRSCRFADRRWDERLAGPIGCAHRNLCAWRRRRASRRRHDAL